MILPGKCIKWLSLQRSGYKNIEANFLIDLRKEFKLMLPYLPKYLETILDIGCGIGAIDVLLHKHYKKSKPNLYLLDSSKQSKKIVYGFDRGESFYNSFEATKELMKVNNIHQYLCVDIEKNNLFFNDIDLIISLLSWGYHYPISVYLEKVRSWISVKGILILNVRKNTDGITQLKKVFKSVNIIDSFNKSDFAICSEVKK